MDTELTAPVEAGEEVAVEPTVDEQAEAKADEPAKKGAKPNYIAFIAQPIVVAKTKNEPVSYTHLTLPTKA